MKSVCLPRSIDNVKADRVRGGIVYRVFCLSSPPLVAISNQDIRDKMDWKEVMCA
jgi:hypothetical protein